MLKAVVSNFGERNKLMLKGVVSNFGERNKLMLKGVVSNLLCLLNPRHVSASKCHPQEVTCSFFKLLKFRIITVNST
jgi:hypothetical protein